MFNKSLYCIYLVMLGLLIRPVAAESVFKAGSQLHVSQAKILEVVVLDATPDFSQGNIINLKQAVKQNDEKALKEALEKIYISPKPISGVEIALHHHANRQSALADSQGKALFPWNLGKATVFLEVVNPAHRLYPVHNQLNASLKADGTAQATAYVRSDAICITGKVTEANGQPVTEAVVIGTLEPLPQVDEGKEPLSISTKTDGNGFYKLCGFFPRPLPQVASFLANGNYTDNQEVPFFVKLTMQRDGKNQPIIEIPLIPLINEKTLNAARLYLSAIRSLAKEDPAKLIEQASPEPQIPPLRGNSIENINITLKKL